MIFYFIKKLYKRFLTKAARACKGKSGTEKTLCMKEYRIKALEMQIKELQKAKKYCAKSKNPVKCKHLLDSKIYKLRMKIQKIADEK